MDTFILLAWPVIPGNATEHLTIPFKSEVLCEAAGTKMKKQPPVAHRQGDGIMGTTKHSWQYICLNENDVADTDAIEWSQT